MSLRHLAPAGALALALPLACDVPRAEPEPCEAPSYDLAADVDAVVAHCKAEVAAECARAFADCDDLWVYTSEYPDLDACAAEAPDDRCVASDRDAVSYVDAGEAAACLAAIPAAACADFGGEVGLPACADVSVLAPPDPSACQAAAPGAVEAAVDVATHRFWGDRVALLCFCADAGAAIRFDLDHGALDSPRMVLFDPAGAELSRDLGGERLEATAPSSGAYMLLIGERDGAPAAPTITGALSL
ncbi:MAG: hypothetical protein R3A79_16500 [Nannocystaceae bacterium]